MFGRPFPLFRIFGFSVKADPSWLIVVVLVVWTLGAVQFPAQFPGLAATSYWLMSLVATVGFFGSIVLHELGHSLAARQFDMPIRGITLFIFGGVAELEREPPTAKSEFWVAVAGPAVSLMLAVISYGLLLVGRAAGLPVEFRGVFYWLAFINVALVVFNAIPAFPLDGGRVLRSILWAARGNLRWATKVTSTLGSLFGLFLIGIGIMFIFGGAFVAGVWNVLIGMFLRAAAAASYQHLLVRRALEGEPVSRFMTPNPKTAPPDISIQELVEDYIYRYHFKMFPVVDETGRLIGCISTDHLKSLPRDEWPTTTVREVAEQCSGRNTIAPDTDAMRALSRMQRLRASRLMVTNEDRLVGIFSLRDVMKLMELRVELDEDADRPDEPDPRQVEREFASP